MYIILFIIFLLIVILFLLIHKPTSQFVDKIIWNYLIAPPVIDQELKNRANIEVDNYFTKKDASGTEIVVDAIKNNIINVDKMVRYKAYIELELLKRKISSFRRFLMTEKEQSRLKYLQLIFKDGPFAVGISQQPTQEIINNIIAYENRRCYAEEIVEISCDHYIPISGHFLLVAIILLLIIILIVFTIMNNNKSNTNNTVNTNNTDNINNTDDTDDTDNSDDKK